MSRIVLFFSVLPVLPRFRLLLFSSLLMFAERTLSVLEEARKRGWTQRGSRAVSEKVKGTARCRTRGPSRARRPKRSAGSASAWPPRNKGTAHSHRRPRRAYSVALSNRKSCVQYKTKERRKKLGFFRRRTHLSARRLTGQWRDTPRREVARDVEGITTVVTDFGFPFFSLFARNSWLPQTPRCRRRSRRGHHHHPPQPAPATREAPYCACNLKTLLHFYAAYTPSLP